MKILIYPESTNPYLNLLYKSLKERNRKNIYSYYPANKFYLLLFPLLAIYYRMRGYTIIHIHWPNFYLSPKHGIPFSQQVSFLYSCLCLITLKLSGYKVIWTVHNILPHEKQTSNDVFFITLLAKICAAKIVHSKSTIDDMKKIGMDTKNTSVIPVGPYTGIYPNKISRAVARKAFNIKPGQKAILFFGIIRPYKGVEELLDAYNRIANPDTMLIIAGSCEDDELLRSIESKLSRGVIFHNKYIPDSDVALYFNASDIACFPFRNITTSSSVLLASAFGKPIIAPLLGAVRDLPVDIGYFYDPAKHNALADTLLHALANKNTLKQKSDATDRFNKGTSWTQISEKTEHIYENTKQKFFS